jgi:hypothetical protein
MKFFRHEGGFLVISGVKDEFARLSEHLGKNLDRLREGELLMRTIPDPGVVIEVVERMEDLSKCP